MAVCRPWLNSHRTQNDELPLVIQQKPSGLPAHLRTSTPSPEALKMALSPLKRYVMHFIEPKD